MVRLSTPQRSLRAMVLVLAGWLAGCTSLSQEQTGSKTWDFSRPYHTQAPARSPHVTSQKSPPLGGLFTAESPKRGNISSHSSSPAQSEKADPKDSPSSPEKVSEGESSPLDTPQRGGSSVETKEKTSVSLLLCEAQEALDQNRNPLAWQDLQQAILCDPADPALWRAAAMVPLRANQPEMASRLASQALQRFPDSAALWQIQALALYREGDFPGAEKAAQQAISLDKRSALSYFLLGAALHQQGQTPQAEAYFHQAASLNPQYANPAPKN